MARTRAWRRYKDYTKAKRKMKLARWPWYSHFHQYSKNKIHCSCPMCRRKTKNNGAAAFYNGVYNPSLMDKRRADAMTISEQEYKRGKMKYVRFFGNNGYVGCDYEDFLAFSEDEYDEEELENMSLEYAQENAETFEYVARGGYYDSWESPEDEEEYWETACDYCGWEYITEEEYKENMNEDY